MMINGVCDGNAHKNKTNLRFVFLYFYELFDPTFPDKRLNQTVFSASDGHC